MALTGGFSSKSSPTFGLALMFANTPSLALLLPTALPLPPAGTAFVKVGIAVCVLAGASGLGACVATGLPAELPISRLRSRVSSSSSSASEGASKASSRSRSSSELCRAVSREWRRDEGCERKDGGGEFGMATGVCARPWSSSSLSKSATCITSQYMPPSSYSLLSCREQAAIVTDPFVALRAHGSRSRCVKSQKI